MLPPETFEVDDKSYTLTQSSRSDAAYDSLRMGLEKEGRRYAAESLASLDSCPVELSEDYRLQIVEKATETFSKSPLYSQFQLWDFAKTHEGLPYLLVICCTEIESLEQAQELVSRMDKIQRGGVLYRAMIAGGMLKEKNSDGSKEETQNPAKLPATDPRFMSGEMTTETSTPEPIAQ